MNHYQLKLAMKLLVLQAFWYFSIKYGQIIFFPITAIILFLVDGFIFRLKNFGRYLIFSILLVCLGLAMDKTFVLLGYLTWGDLFYPYQLLSVWIIFPCYYTIFFERFKSKVFLSFIIGAVFGPFAYVSGGKISGVISTEGTGMQIG